MAFSNFICCVLLVLFSFSNQSIANGARDKPTQHVRPSSCSASTRGPGSDGLKIFNKYGPCSPLGSSNSDSNLEKMLRKDQARVDDMNNKFQNNEIDTSQSIEQSKSRPIKVEPASGGSIYVVKVGFGTPKRDFTLIMDTGSDITWMQCKPCSEKCYPQKEPMFDPSASSTFSRDSCHPPEPTYSVKYLDNSYSNGNYGCDTLTLSPHEVYPNFRFGCGDNNSGDFNGAAGLLALGKGGDTDSRLVRNFCFCLLVRKDSEGYLYFGKEAQQKCKTQNSLPLLKGTGGKFSVNLVGISIGRKRLSVSSYYSSRPRTIIDSGTIITRLPPSVYSDLQQEFKKSMSKYPESGSQGIPDTCYNLEGFNNPQITEMVLHFQGSKDIVLDNETVLIKVNESQVYCLAFAGNQEEKDMVIIGSHQMRGLNWNFDTQDETIGFGKGNC